MMQESIFLVARAKMIASAQVKSSLSVSDATSIARTISREEIQKALQSQTEQNLLAASNVSDFYSTGWDALLSFITFGGWLVALFVSVVGIAMPFFSQWRSKIKIEREIAATKKELQADILKSAAEIRRYVESEVSDIDEHVLAAINSIDESRDDAVTQLDAKIADLKEEQQRMKHFVMSENAAQSAQQLELQFDSTNDETMLFLATISWVFSVDHAIEGKEIEVVGVRLQKILSLLSERPTLKKRVRQHYYVEQGSHLQGLMNRWLSRGTPYDVLIRRLAATLDIDVVQTA